MKAYLIVWLKMQQEDSRRNQEISIPFTKHNPTICWAIKRKFGMGWIRYLSLKLFSKWSEIIRGKEWRTKVMITRTRATVGTYCKILSRNTEFKSSILPLWIQQQVLLKNTVNFIQIPIDPHFDPRNFDWREVDWREIASKISNKVSSLTIQHSYSPDDINSI